MIGNVNYLWGQASESVKTGTPQVYQSHAHQDAGHPGYLVWKVLMAPEEVAALRSERSRPTQPNKTPSSPETPQASAQAPALCAAAPAQGAASATAATVATAVVPASVAPSVSVARASPSKLPPFPKAKVLLPQFPTAALTTAALPQAPPTVNQAMHAGYMYRAGGIMGLGGDQGPMAAELCRVLASPPVTNYHRVSPLPSAFFSSAALDAASFRACKLRKGFHPPPANPSWPIAANTNR